ncbi:DUF4913 domain-containing protein [Nocardia wallacei]|uniref:DUF4913 domain-containing protein n=1 Tax=Nocardia wallacei TaxID=480035 RepID=UPI002456AB89|nr:DUF4913 domain-containing protein [Nocardia wallacei]
MTDTTPHTNGVAANGDGATAAESAAAHSLPAADLGELMDAAIRKAVTAEFGAAAKDIAADVVSKFLTADVRKAMAETAIHEAELALNPPVPAEEPDPEPKPEAQDEPEPPRRLYATVEDFVQEYVCELYRREVSEIGLEGKRRWCPEWWRHGEARARFEALHTAFEAMRQGETVEMSVFWLTHFGPTMQHLFDPEGPFKYCSVPKGHHAGLVALPVVPAPEDYSNSDYQGGGGAELHDHYAGGLVVETGPVRRGRVVLERFP